MISKAATIEQYIEELPADRKEPFTRLRNTILKNIPKGFKEKMSYGMTGWVVPHDLFPAGYHCDPQLPLPFAGIASQKHFIALYHMGIYCDPRLLKWFTSEYSKQSAAKLDMGKSCIRFKKPADIPFKLNGELMKKMTVKDWITVYEQGLKQAKSKGKSKK